MTLIPAQYSKTQRWLLTTLGGLGVVALAAGAFVLSYDDLRLLALRGGAARHWAFLYPWMLDGLVVLIILAILTARRSGWFARTARWLLLVLLIAGACAAGVQRAVKGYAVLPDTPVNVGVAVAPWAILMIAVWLWVSMIKQVLNARRSRPRRDEPAGAVEPVPAAAVLDQSIVPGLGPGDTRRLPLPPSVRELEPVREPEQALPAEEPPSASTASTSSTAPDVPAAPAAPSEPEPNPWDAARIDTSRPWKRDEAAETRETSETPESSTAGPEPSDPVPASWRAEPDVSPADLAAEDDTQPLPTRTPPPGSDEPTAPSWQDEAAEPDTREPEPLLPPTRSRLGERRDEPDDKPDDKPGAEPDTAASAPDEPAPSSLPETPMSDETAEPAEDEPSHRLVARPFLPTDVRLVGGPKPPLSDTRPDGIRLPDTNPDGIPLVTKTSDGSDTGDDEDDGYADERAEDPDAGDDEATGGPWAETAATPPSSTFRSGPTPPRG